MTLRFSKHEVRELKRIGYAFGKRISQGVFTAVHKVVNWADVELPQHMVCKTYFTEMAPPVFTTKFIPREVEMIPKLEHPNVVQAHSIVEIGYHLFIFMEYAEKGDLFNLISEEGGLLEGHAMIFFHQIVAGLRYLHDELGIAHRDIKCENVLVFRHRRVKLSNFGFARDCSSGEGEPLSRTFCGTFVYVAPEVVNTYIYDPKAADMWSLGVVLYAMVSYCMPFNDTHVKKFRGDQLARSWSFGQIHDRVSPAFRSLVAKLLEPDVTKRLTMNGLKLSKWMNKKIQGETVKKYKPSPEGN